MNIYYARSLRGDKPALNIDTSAVRALINKLGHRPQFDLVHDIPRTGLTEEQFIHDRDLAWLDQCHSMIAEVSAPSGGVGYGIAYAHHVLHLPILCVAQAGARKSAMFSRVTETVWYSSWENLEFEVRKWVAKLPTLAAYRHDKYGPIGPPSVQP